MRPGSVANTAAASDGRPNARAADRPGRPAPAGRIVGLVGANGVGKTTLMHLTAGLLASTTGTITALGARPAADPEQLATVGFLAQDAPVYGSLTVAESPVVH